MITSGLVLTLHNDGQAAHKQVEDLAKLGQGFGKDRLSPFKGSLTLGKPVGHRLPVVLETENESESERAFEVLRETAGVEAVDVVYVQYIESASQHG